MPENALVTNKFSKYDINNLTDILVGDCPAMNTIRLMAQEVAQKNYPVLICGETGSGKSLLARIIHQQSQRPGKLCVIDPSVMDHFALDMVDTQEGTLVIDNIDECATKIQKEIVYCIDQVQQMNLVRLIFTANCPVDFLSSSTVFRRDLYYRISSIVLDIPKLAVRGKNDILALVQKVLEEENNHQPALRLSRDATQMLCQYSWPGNVRELINVMRNCILLTTKQVIDASLLSHYTGFSGEPTSTERTIDKMAGQTSDDEPLSLEEYFQKFILEHQDSMNEADLAKKLGISRKCLWDRRQRFNISRKKNRATKS